MQPCEHILQLRHRHFSCLGWQQGGNRCDEEKEPTEALHGAILREMGSGPIVAIWLWTLHQ
jgi:hypothetical protein